MAAWRGSVVVDVGPRRRIGVGGFEELAAQVLQQAGSGGPEFDDGHPVVATAVFGARRARPCWSLRHPDRPGHRVC
jgi:hypothetical protein